MMTGDTFGKRPAMTRRRFLGAACAVCAGSAWARESKAGGVSALTGQAFINGRPAVDGLEVRPGDHVVVGHGAQMTFVSGVNVFRLRPLTDFALGSAEVLRGALRLVTGGLLAVFGDGRHTIVTPRATMGIRGSGLYVESDPEQLYLCNCYGTARVVVPLGGGRTIEQEFTATHHNARLLAPGPGGELELRHAAQMNHTDEELVALEGLAGRTPPFAR